MTFHIIGISVTAKIARITARDEIGIFKFIMQIGDDRMVTADKYKVVIYTLFCDYIAGSIELINSCGISRVPSFIEIGNICST
jgi:hypothetical protein